MVVLLEKYCLHSPSFISPNGCKLEGTKSGLYKMAWKIHWMVQLQFSNNWSNYTVSRCGCEKTCTLLGQLFDQNAQNYQKLFCSSSRNQLEITVQEGRLAWLVYFVGIFVGGILMHTITDEHDAMDGELSCWVFQLMPFLDAQLPQASNEKVELAILWFLDQFHKTYVGEQPQHTSKVG
ncbi:ran-binding protein 17-like [Phasianus colchicus]|uniref:ran-binding protein 17-like n=1 Tax=Phasianus colchicus TaxID=9054 RepID=UPI00129E6601|nr:ran-binding protein 17-like [Phasianus colchicus]